MRGWGVLSVAFLCLLNPSFLLGPRFGAVALPQQGTASSYALALPPPPTPVPTASSSPTNSRTETSTPLHTATNTRTVASAATASASTTNVLCFAPPGLVVNGAYDTSCYPARDGDTCPMICASGHRQTAAIICQRGQWTVGACAAVTNLMVVFLYPASVDLWDVSLLLEVGCASLGVSCQYVLFPMVDAIEASVRLVLPNNQSALVLAALQQPHTHFGTEASLAAPAVQFTASDVSGLVVGEGAPPAVDALKVAVLQVAGVALPESSSVSVATNVLGWQAQLQLLGTSTSAPSALNGLPASLQAVGATGVSLAPSGQLGPMVFLPAASRPAGAVLAFSGNADTVCWTEGTTAADTPDPTCPCVARGSPSDISTAMLIKAIGCLGSNATPVSSKLVGPTSASSGAPDTTSSSSPMPAWPIAPAVAAAVAAGCLLYQVRQRQLLGLSAQHAVDSRWQQAAQQDGMPLSPLRL